MKKQEKVNTKKIVSDAKEDFSKVKVDISKILNNMEKKFLFFMVIVLILLILLSLVIK